MGLVAHEAAAYLTQLKAGLKGRWCKGAHLTWAWPGPRPEPQASSLECRFVL